MKNVELDEGLIGAINELNDLLFEPAEIPTEGEMDVIVLQLKKAVALIEPEDTITEETIAALRKIDCWVENEEAPVELTLLEEVQACTKINQLKSIAKANDEFKSIRGGLTKFKEVDALMDVMVDLLTAEVVEEVKEIPEEKKAPMKVVKDEKKEEPVVKKTTPKPAAPKKVVKKETNKKEVTRSSAFVEIYNEGIPLTKDELVTALLEKYPKSKSEVNAKIYVGVYTSLLVDLGIFVKTKEGKFVKTK